MKIYFTIFTPVYNRRHKIHRVWESLQMQTYRNFEWIVVDDGSTDNIGPLLEEYKQQANFPVTILTQPNSGKHIAWNRAVKIAKGQLFVPADSDDDFIPETLDFFAEKWANIPIENRESYSGINVLCKDSTTEQIVGEEFPESPMVSNNLELTYRYRITGEKWGCIRTDLLAKRMFPEVKTGRGCFPLSWLWFWLAGRYNVLCINKVLRIYYQDDKNCIMQKTPNRLSSTANERYMAKSWHLSENIDYLFMYETKKDLAKSFVVLWKTGFLAKKNILGILGDLKSRKSKLFAILTLLPGVAFYVIAHFVYWAKNR